MLGGRPSLVGELETARAREPSSRAPARPAHARALPQRAAGGGASGLPGGAQDARRGARHRADTLPAAAARLDPAPGVRAAAPGRPRGGRGPSREVVRALLSGRLVHVLGPAPSSAGRAELGRPVGRGLRLPRGTPRRPDARLAVRGRHPGRRSAVRPAPRALRRERRTGPRRALSREPARARTCAWRRAPTARHDRLRQLRSRARSGARRRRGRRLVRRARPEPWEVPAPSAGRLGDRRRRSELVRGALPCRAARDPQGARRSRSTRPIEIGRASSSARTTTSGTSRRASWRTSSP